MEEEKIVSDIVDEIATKVIGKEYIFLQNNLSNNNIQRYDNKEILTPLMKGKNKEKIDIVKRFIGKKERKSKVIINNDNIGLYLRQERNGDSKWNVHVIDLSVIDEPRIETEKFGDNYKEAEKYYGKLFFKYQFNEIKKETKIKKEDDNLKLVKKRKKKKKGRDQFPMSMFGMISGAGLSFAFFLPMIMWAPPSMAAPSLVLFTILGAGGGGMLGWACE